MSFRTRNLHAWKTRDDDGRKREVRAQLYGSRWTFSQRYVDEDEWVTYRPPSMEDLEDLYDVLYRKYQRNHLAYEHLELVKKLIEARQ